MDGNKAWLTGDGFTEKGQFPFVDEFDLKTKLTKRIYTSTYTDKKLDIISIVDVKNGEYIVRLQSPTEFPNFYVLNIRRRIAPVAITFFENPFKSLANVHKEVVKYKRDDGVELTGTLYLPAGYDIKRKNCRWSCGRIQRNLLTETVRDKIQPIQTNLFIHRMVRLYIG